MAKLFALEEEEKSGNNELIIDKLLEKTEEKKSPMSLTADLLKQRDQVNKDVKEHIEKTEEEQEEDQKSDDDQGDEGDSSEVEDKGSESEETPQEEEEEEDSAADDTKAADDKDSLSSLVGSGLKEGSEEKEPKDSDKESDTKKEKEETATESFSVNRVTLRNIFTPIVLAHEGYKEQLSIYNLSMEALPTEKQPVVYVKEAIVESISRLTKLANSYIDNTKTSIETYTESLVKLNERLAVFSKLVEAGKHQFTHKLVKDREVLSAISLKGHSDPRETSRTLLNYLNASNKAISLAVNNGFEELRNAFTSKDFTEEGDDLVYSKQLPGFLLVKVATVPYTNYLKTKLENYQYYNLKALKLEDLYELPGISITEDKDIEYIVKTLNDLVISAGVSIDTLKGITEHFNSFVNDLKVLSYDVQNDKYENLADLGIDAKVQDFIKFKLAMEASFININMSMNYIISMSGVLDVCLELSE